MDKRILKSVISALLIKPAVDLLKATDAAKQSLVETMDMNMDEATALVNEVLDGIYDATQVAKKEIARYKAQGKTVEDLKNDIDKNMRSKGIDVDGLDAMFEDLSNLGGRNA